MHADGLSTIHGQIMWNRLISVVEEQAQTLVRTAFSTTVREAGDLSAGVFDREGRMLAQAVTGTPGHVNSMALAVGHFIAKYPLETMEDGDAFVTNDPWQTCGHLHDITVVTPAFHKGRPVGLFACTAHVTDIGGRGFGPDGRQVFEEGLAIPIMHLARRGQMNRDLLELVRANVRTPRLVEGDLFSLAACNEAGARRLVDMMTEFELGDLDGLAAMILEASRRATLERVRALPAGTWRNKLIMDGYDKPIDLVAALTIGQDGIHVDFEGTSPASGYGINVVLNYTLAYTSFGIKCIVAPEVPNNAGSLAPFTVKAPEGSILNVKRPWPVAARHVIGHMLPDLVLGCLHPAIAGGVPAEGAASLWNPQLRGGPATTGMPATLRPGRNVEPIEFDIVTFNSGGTGARPTKDGMNATAFPSGVRTMPVEATEQVAPIVIWRKELRPDSGGAGTWRGGVGQVIEIGGVDDDPFHVLAMFDRCDNAPKGRDGGVDGARGAVRLKSGKKLHSKGQQPIPEGDRLILELPGGAGFGDPRRRDPARVAADAADGLVSPDRARVDYGVALDGSGGVDEAATRALRAAQAAD